MSRQSPFFTEGELSFSADDLLLVGVVAGVVTVLADRAHLVNYDLVKARQDVSESGHFLSSFHYLRLNTSWEINPQLYVVCVT